MYTHTHTHIYIYICWIYAESEKHEVKNSLPRKTVIKNRKRDKEFPWKTKTKGVLDHYSSPTRNFKGELLSGEKMKQNKKDQSNTDKNGTENITRNTKSTGKTMALNSYLSVL